MRAPALLALLALSSSCVSASWNRATWQRPAARDVVAGLPRSGIGLQECLDLLGAPTLVFEHRVHGLTLAYAWVQDRRFGGTVSVPLGDRESASFSYATARAGAYALVLWLDESWVLEDWREGRLGSLIGEEPPRPATLEEIELTRR